jgi:hypothetical protein
MNITNNFIIIFCTFFCIGFIRADDTFNALSCGACPQEVRTMMNQVARKEGIVPVQLFNKPARMSKQAVLTKACLYR